MREQKNAKRTSDRPVIYIVDDDISIREALLDLFSSMQFEAEAFGSPNEFVAQADLTRAGCIVLDVRLPGVSGIEFQTQLERAGNQLPIVFMTGHGDISMGVQAMKAGAVDFLTKPFREQDLLDAVSTAISRDCVRRQELQRHQEVMGRFETLTQREREVLEDVVAGLMNKQIAFKLGISEITVKLHRGNVMRKMEAKSIADLVRMVEQANELLNRKSQPVIGRVA
ncbi:response regulator transcription factor [Rhizobium sp. Rhizsp42]|uniref:response regulator transcription factor n=1 Tax=Rhizobium sp. Rhizsp42 TaxID=3243034 RepID=UPI000DD777FF